MIQKIYEKYEEKKVGVAGLQPLSFSLDYSKLLNQNFTTFCTANQSTKTNLRNLFDFLSNQIFSKIIFIVRLASYL